MQAAEHPALKPGFWKFVDRLVAESQVVIDRPKNSHHPRFADRLYPLDYGYLAQTSSPDGHEVDVWVGSQIPARVVAVLLTVDLGKRDVEMKLLLGCTPAEIALVTNWSDSDQVQVALIPRREEPHPG
jgi:inorganic pyrophosphatase